MSIAKVASRSFRWLRAGMASIAMLQLAIGQTVTTQTGSASSSLSAPNDGKSDTPIKHVIVIIGENRSFDHVFATYQPKQGQSVWNLLSQGIINADGSPGRNFNQALQSAATDTAPDAFLLSPSKGTFPGGVLPAPLAGGPTDSYVAGDSLSLAEASENGCPLVPSITTI